MSGPNLRIGFVRIFVTDLARSREFYTDVLGLKPDYTDGTSWAQYHAGRDVGLALETCDPAHEEPGGKLVGRFVGVSLVVDDIEATHRTFVERGVRFTATPERQPWGGTLAHFADPDGNVLTLYEEGT